ncbi:MAG: DNA-directed RNA polymerase subunit alpha [Candidatus Desulfofervidaceae bacterium]|nr:DNA-directed RNA polymerase subunit alpha [Candidatus Desulfofervidaceae bacterium]
MNKSSRVNLIKPQKVERDEETYSSHYGKFTYEPLERGYGITIGNALRRILLSSIEGAAITSVKIEGVSHEFSTIPGVMEDVTDIILNLKQVRLKLHGEPPCTIKIEREGEGEVKAGDIITDGSVEVVNPDQHIATLTSKGRLFMEMVVNVGRGYVPAERNKEEGQPLGTIPVDAIFSPIKKVNFTVRNARVGQMTDYDKLILEVWTDGTITPEKAISQAAHILIEQLEFFLSPDEVRTSLMAELVEEEEEEVPREVLYRSIDELDLSVRALNCLKNANINLIGELVQKTESELLKTRNFGRKSLNEIKNVLTQMGLNLGMELKNFPDPEILEKVRKESYEA